MNHLRKFETVVADMKLDGRYRTFIEIERLGGRVSGGSMARSGRSKAGDGLVQQRLFRDGQHSDVVAAMHSAIGRSGAGTGGTRNISGNQSQHVALETSLADMHGKEVSFVFTSGWISDLATLSTLGEVLPDAVIF